MTIAHVTLGPSRPRRSKIDRIIVHAMGEWIGADPKPAWAFLHELGLSCHAFVTPSGVIVRQVPDDRIAFHARGDNATSLGIEVLVPGVLLGLDELYAQMRTPYTSHAQYQAAVRQVSEWMSSYELRVEDVHPHSARDSRKRDPGDGFPWDRFLSDLIPYARTLS